MTHEAAPLGPAFFAQILPALVRSCPCPEGAQPVVQVHLTDGAILDVAQVVGIEERFVVLAAYEGVGADGIERTVDDVGLEAIPYELVLRVTVRALPAETRLGFSPVVAPILPLESSDQS